MPNARRKANQKRLKREGLRIERALYDRLQNFVA